MSIPLIFGSLGALAVFIFYARFKVKTENWFDGKTVVEGILTQCIRIDGGEGLDTYECVIEYENGRRIEGGWLFDPKDVGSLVPVAFDPNNPADAKPVIEESAGDRLGVLVVAGFVFFALYLIGFGVAGIIAHFSGSNR
jgi:hypothetical protein